MDQAFKTFVTNRGYSVLGLFHPKFDYNIGGVVRAAACYGVNSVFIQGRRFRKHPTDAGKAHRHMPIFQVDDLMENIPYGCVPVAVEIREDAKLLPHYFHYPRSFYIFGPEDGSLPDKIVTKCKDVLYIPTEQCMNLAATVNVVLYDRLAKTLKEGRAIGN